MSRKPSQGAVFKYLDGLHQSGITNMYGARPYVQSAFPSLTPKEAGAHVAEWMRTFSERHPQMEKE